MCVCISLCIIDRPNSPLIEHKNSERGIRSSLRGSTRKSHSRINVSDPIEEFRRKTKTPEMESHPPIPVNMFLEHLGYMRTNDNQLLVTEFSTIPMSPDYPREVAEASYNMEKNRYDNILPYDHTRVKLSIMKWQEGSDYINGSNVDVSALDYHASPNIHVHVCTLYLYMYLAYKFVYVVYNEYVHVFIIIFLCIYYI